MKGILPTELRTARGTILVGSKHGRQGAVSQGSAPKPAVRSGSAAKAYRLEARCHAPIERDRRAPGILDLTDRVMRPRQNLHRPLIRIVVVVAVLWSVQEVLTHLLVSLPVRPQRLEQLVHGVLPVIEDQLLNRRQGIRHVDPPEMDRDGPGVVLLVEPGQVDSPLEGLVQEERVARIRAVLHGDLVSDVPDIHADLHVEQQPLTVGIENLVGGSHLPRVLECRSPGGVRDFE